MKKQYYNVKLTNQELVYITVGLEELEKKIDCWFPSKSLKVHQSPVNKLINKIRNVIK